MCMQRFNLVYTIRKDIRIIEIHTYTEKNLLERNKLFENVEKLETTMSSFNDNIMEIFHKFINIDFQTREKE